MRLEDDAGSRGTSSGGQNGSGREAGAPGGATAPDARPNDAGGGDALSMGPPPCSPAPSDFITDFSLITAGPPIAFPGGWTYTYGGASLAAGDGALRVAFQSSPMGAPWYAGFGLTFANCIDASAFGGVRFTMSGTTTCQLLLGVDSRGNTPPITDPRGTCDQGPGLCYPATSPPQMVAPVPTTITVRFRDMVRGSPPAPAVDASTVLGFDWVLVAPTDGCAADLTLDDVSFVP